MGKLINHSNGRKDSGFTIVELLVVIVVIGILASITIVSYTGVTARAKDAQALSNAQAAAQVAEVMNADNGNYPITAASFATGSTTTKLPSGVTVKVGTTLATETAITSTDGQTSVSFSCTGACTAAGITGGRITYWSVGSTGVKYVYFGAANSSSTFVAPGT